MAGTEAWANIQAWSFMRLVRFAKELDRHVLATVTSLDLTVSTLSTAGITTRSSHLPCKPLSVWMPLK